ncbi:Thioredoxin domain containing 12 (Endoplasmic reticulum) [Nesidiocoris tenuis]|uniref:Thioredoxin domain containing 12 (Endoplasmic reticulum) n=1 Tax=Nesidiocoris tenuis TaxID=355587 RepID=A0ABN7AZC9_9HEMI|nr:Thioredoxin domain containing 12 (Endoplasmic reticulum) [Nesidiocoris tenuis]
MGMTDWLDRWFGCINDWNDTLSKFIEDKNFDSHGMTTRIQWHQDFGQAVASAVTRNVPIMLVVHATDCRSCKSFREWFSRSSGVIELSQHFSAVALAPEDVPNDVHQLESDGAYVPRVMFLVPKGPKVLLVKEGARKQAEEGQKHFFPGTTPLLESMRAVLANWPKY